MIHCSVWFNDLRLFSLDTRGNKDALIGSFSVFGRSTVLPQPNVDVFVQQIVIFWKSGCGGEEPIFSISDALGTITLPGCFFYRLYQLSWFWRIVFVGFCYLWTCHQCFRMHCRRMTSSTSKRSFGILSSFLPLAVFSWWFFHSREILYVLCPVEATCRNCANSSRLLSAVSLVKS